jgi:3-oxoacyl-[acyl-carrier-protein] synthase-3
MSTMSAVIKGCGSYLPRNLVTNQQLSETVDTSHEWIVERTGIHQRYFAAPDEYTSDMATHAAQDALAMAGLTADQVDLIICGTASPDNTFPSAATRVQAKLGNTHALAFDVAAACAGYLLALNVANLHIRQGTVKRALVIGAEKISSLMDMSDRSTCVLFGDGAGAVVLEGVPADQNLDQRGILGVHLQSDGRYFDILNTDGGPSSTGTVGRLRMEGKEVFKHAVTKLAESAEWTLAHYGLSTDDIDWVIPHQANIRIIDGLLKRLNIPSDRAIITVDQHANTSSASIPLALAHAVKSGKVKPGDLILHEAIGGGLVWGSALVRF